MPSETPSDSAPFQKTPRFKDHEGFLELSYEDLQKRNLDIKSKRTEGKLDEKELREKLKEESRIKAVTLCFTDMEGRLHTLDYNKDYFLDSSDNLTFDGSSIKGFAQQNLSDLRLVPDWSSLRYTPADVFGAGKVIVFANVHAQDGEPYIGDFRSNLRLVLDELKKDHELTVNVAPEIEGFLFEGQNAEQNYRESEGFELASKGGYFHTLPQDRLRIFIDRLAEATRAMGFENEKDHGEVAPSQFELAYQHAEALYSADQIQIYKLVARQIAKSMGLTASFLPKPVPGINGSGMHMNISMMKEDKNTFYDKEGEWGLSDDAHNFTNGVLSHAPDICLGLNSSVNSYRRLDPAFEAPNEIKVSPSDRSAMIRVPLGNEKSARVEVRTVAPDANPYLALFLTIRAGLKSMLGSDEEKKAFAEVRQKPGEKLPDNIVRAIKTFRRSDFIREVMCEENRDKYGQLKREVAERSPLQMGKSVKNWEIWDHHEVSNQSLQGLF